MQELKVKFNELEKTAVYNKQSGYYEVEFTTTEVGGIFPTTIKYNDFFDEQYEDDIDVQVLAKQKIKIDQTKMFMWVFDWEYFSVKDIIEISDYEINLDEETNSNSTINVAKETKAVAEDIIAIKMNGETIYWGIIQEIQNDSGENLYKYITKYITNIFDRQIQLGNEEVITKPNQGLETFLENEIKANFTNTTDTFINMGYILTNVKSHTNKQCLVTNVENGIYNLHTWLTNCTQNYNIVYDFEIYNDGTRNYLRMNIENREQRKELIDCRAEGIANYNEVFETKITSKVIATNGVTSYTLYLLNDKTTTQNKSNPNRVKGKVTTIHVEDVENMPQECLNVFKGNSYNHNISFELNNKYFKLGQPVSIKTKKSIVHDTYISSITYSKSKFVKYQCGNIRTNFIDKILKERNK